MGISSPGDPSLGAALEGPVNRRSDPYSDDDTCPPASGSQPTHPHSNELAEDEPHGYNLRGRAADKNPESNALFVDDPKDGDYRPGNTHEVSGVYSYFKF